MGQWSLRGSVRQLAAGVLLVLWASGCGADSESRSAAPATQTGSGGNAAWQEMAELGPGFVIWESNRSGSWRIWIRQLDGSGLRQLSPDQPRRDHFGAHVSPDGTRVAYLSYPRPYNSYRRAPPDAAVELRLLSIADGTERVLAPDAQSYGESRSVVWVDGHRLIYLGRDGATRELDIGGGEDRILAESSENSTRFLVNATRTHGTSNNPTFSIFDEKAGSFVRRPDREGCQPYFSHDGRWAFWTTRSGGPLKRIHLGSERMGTILERNDPRLPEEFGYLYFPMVSPGQRLLAFGASRDQHDHFRGDYEIFVAPIDPRTLEITGDPVRYTFDGATDRFPDVYLAGLELGHHEGEAPYSIDLDPAGLGSDPVADAVWVWNFGDGSQAAGAIGRHTFPRPGTYTVTARHGARVLRARVDVDEPAPPEPLRALVRDREVLVVFDEPIAVEVAELRLASGTPIVNALVGADRHTLHIKTAAPMPATDRLTLSGVRDRAAVPNHVGARVIELTRVDWPSRREDLVFLFGTRDDDNRVGKSGREQAFELAPRGRARYDRSQALSLAGGAFEAEGAGKSVGRACRRSGEFTLEALIHPDRTSSSGHIVSLADDDDDPLFYLMQKETRLRVGFRTETDPEIGVAEVGSTEPLHLVVSYRDGRLVSYRNGTKVLDTDRVQGDLSEFSQARQLRFGDSAEGGNDWRGSLEGVAIYCRVMEDEEAAANADAYLTRIAERKAVQRLRVRARLLNRSHVPSLEEISPYREALVLYEYEVVEGDLAEERLRVAHWAILAGKTQAIASVRPGATQMLTLESLADNEQVASAYLSDTLDLDAEAALYLDVTP